MKKSFNTRSVARKVGVEDADDEAEVQHQGKSSAKRLAIALV
jgi:hypothetical protein